MFCLLLGHTNGAQGLLLILYSGFTPGGAQEYICNNRGGTDYIQSKNPTPTITLVPSSVVAVVVVVFNFLSFFKYLVHAR